VAEMAPPWPAIGWEPTRWTTPWEVTGPAGQTIDTAVPVQLATQPLDLSPSAEAALAAATDAVRVLDASTTVDLTALAGALLRSESVASSKIEHLDASQRDLGLAMLRGVPVHTAAAHVAANVRAMSAAVNGPDPSLPYHVVDLMHVHRLLLEADPYEGGWAGRLRTMQNWIGGGDVSPHGALFVPPAPRRVPGLMDDLVRFCNRTDLDPVAQAAVAHAQFETIHPFTDGNGRTGRALVHVVLRRRGLTRRTVVPVSTVLLADVEGYFDGLGDFREGRIEDWVRQFASATSRAASAGLTLAEDLARLRERWRDGVRPRQGSAAAVLLEALLRQPVVDIGSVRELVGHVADKNLYAAVDRLESVGVLTELSGAGRNRVWAAMAVLDLLEQLEARLGRRSGRGHPPRHPPRVSRRP
jgi:Fic family protein